MQLIKKLYLKVFGEAWLGRSIRYKLVKKNIEPGEKFLDVGCGDGFYLDKLNNKFGFLTGIEIDSKFKITRADGKFIPFKNGIFDCILCSEVLEHDINPEKIIKEISRVIKHKGVFLLTTPSKSVIKLPDHVVSGYSISELKKMLKDSGFIIEKTILYFKRFGYFIWKIERLFAGKLLGFILFPIFSLLVKIDNLIGGEGKFIFIKTRKL